MGERWSPSAQSSATLAEEDSANSEVRFQVQQVPFNHATPAPHNRARSGDVMDTVDRVGVEQTEPDHHNEPAFSGPSEQQSQSTRSTLAEEVEGDGPATEAGVHHNIGQPFGGQVVSTSILSGGSCQRITDREVRPLSLMLTVPSTMSKSDCIMAIGPTLPSQLGAQTSATSWTRMES